MNDKFLTYLLKRFLMALLTRISSGRSIMILVFIRFPFFIKDCAKVSAQSSRKLSGLKFRSKKFHPSGIRR